METNKEILAAREKLKAKFESRIGGKGTVRRKTAKKPSGAGGMDSSKLTAQVKKLGLQTIPSIEEVNMFHDKGGPIIHFDKPKVQAGIQANTFVINGKAEEKKVDELLPGIIPQMGAGATSYLKDMQKLLSQMQANPEVAAAAAAAKKDIPDIDSFETK